MSLRNPYGRRAELKEMSIYVIAVVRILEGMFIAGSLGCVVVLALTSLEDMKTLVGLDSDESETDAADVTRH